MCGLFGFMSGYEGKPNRDTFEEVAADTAARGPQAWGVAWLEQRGKAEVIRHYKQAGDVRHSMRQAWDLIKDASVFIFHTRLATHGNKNNLNNHPHACDGGWLIHNGVVKNYQEIKARIPGHMSDCDSESICRLIETEHGRLPDRVKGAIDATRGNLAIAALWKRPACLIIARRGNPLSVGRGSDGLWFSSLGKGFDSASVADNTLIEYRYRGGLPMVYRKRKLQAGLSVQKKGGHYDPSGRLIQAQISHPHKPEEEAEMRQLNYFGIEEESQFDVVSDD